MEATRDQLQHFMYQIDSALMDHGKRGPQGNMGARGEVADEHILGLFIDLAESLRPDSIWGRLRVSINRSYHDTGSSSWVALHRHVLDLPVTTSDAQLQNSALSVLYVVNESRLPQERIAITRSITLLGRTALGGPKHNTPSSQELVALGDLITNKVTYNKPSD